MKLLRQFANALVVANFFMKLRLKHTILYKDSRLKWYILSENYIQDVFHENEKILFSIDFIDYIFKNSK